MVKMKTLNVKMGYVRPIIGFHNWYLKSFREARFLIFPKKRLLSINSTGNFRVFYKCPRCGKYPTPEGHDACLGTLKGVKSACCGHGIDDGYILYKDGRKEKISKKQFY